MQSKATTVEQYLDSLPEDRRKTIEAVRKVLLENFDDGIEEGMSYGMIGYYIPHSIYPKGYHCEPSQPLPFVNLASQKNHISLYLMCFYGRDSDEQWLRREWEKTDKKLDMGKSCIRFKKLDDLPLALIGKAIRRVKIKDYIEFYDSVFSKTSAKKSTTAKSNAPADRKAAPKKSVKRVAKKSAKKKPDAN